ncbi:hypothetical protein [Nitrosopumilus adriaticus]|uniref:Uncharacterized protein n=1 Tax=Nitrosopumilus adriaticus TaxID=1580092 RepID=A0A0D5C3Q5_9ARCH|nr:hypothetical protein [Nitrosopumilus adriaticus]AJW71198.1 hypothetical protein NADRNF5_1517 [Nitrosopumilus adriaticus]
MDESQISSFVMWSVITGVVMVITGLSYRAYLRTKNNEIPPS